MWPMESGCGRSTTTSMGISWHVAATGYLPEQGRDTEPRCRLTDLDTPTLVIGQFKIIRQYSRPVGKDLQYGASFITSNERPVAGFRTYKSNGSRTMCPPGHSHGSVQDGRTIVRSVIVRTNHMARRKLDQGGHRLVVSITRA